MAYHIIDKTLLFPGAKQEEAKQIIRDEKVDSAINEANKFYSFAREQFRVIQDSVKQVAQNKEIPDGSVVIPREEWLNTANTIKTGGNSVMSKLSDLNIPPTAGDNQKLIQI